MLEGVHVRFGYTASNQVYNTLANHFSNAKWVRTGPVKAFMNMDSGSLVALRKARSTTWTALIRVDFDVISLDKFTIGKWFEISTVTKVKNKVGVLATIPEDEADELTSFLKSQE